MAWRLGAAVIDGLLDNSQHGLVSARIRFARAVAADENCDVTAMEPFDIKLELQGDLPAELRGTVISITNPEACAEAPWMDDFNLLGAYHGPLRAVVEDAVLLFDWDAPEIGAVQLDLPTDWLTPVAALQ